MKIFGISVHVIEPGATATNFIEEDNMTKAANEVWGRVPESIRRVYGSDYLQTSKLLLSLSRIMRSMCTFMAAFCQNTFEFLTILQLFENIVIIFIIISLLQYYYCFI